MQFGRVMSDSSESEQDTQSTAPSDVYQPLVGFSRNDGVSGSDVPSDEEEDDESDIVEVIFFLLIEYWNNTVFHFEDIFTQQTCSVDPQRFFLP